jgi:hypothetical protein
MLIKSMLEFAITEKNHYLCYIIIKEITSYE